MMDLDVHTIAIIGIIAILPAITLAWVGWRIYRFRSPGRRPNDPNAIDANGEDET